MPENDDGTVTNIIEGEAANVMQIGDGEPGSSTTNIIRGSATNVIQAGTIRGGVHLGH